ncbi:MAG: autotransporter domain-containing protein [Afipia sp.]
MARRAAKYLPATAVLVMAGAAWADSFDAIPMPAGGMFGSASAISADGSTVVGSYIDPNSSMFAFRWTGSGAAGDLGYLGAVTSGTFATAVNADGSVVVGTSGNRAFRWTQATGMVGLPYLPGGDPASGGWNYGSSAFGVSGDGSVVVGQGVSTQFQAGEAFRWTQATGSVGLGTLDTMANVSASSKATAVSADGQVIVGNSTSDTYQMRGEAFRWTQGTGMVGLGTLTGTALGSYSVANAVNANGSVIVGQSSSNTVIDPIFMSSGEAFRWTQATGMVGLGTLAPSDIESNALAVSADGSVIVGYSRNDSWVSTAFRWTESTGMKSVQSLLTAAGVNITGWHLDSATGVSGDGSVIVGSGTDSNGDQQAWIARFSPIMGTGIITSAAVARSFAGQGAVRQTAGAAVNGTLGIMNELATQGRDASDNGGKPYSVFAFGAYDSDPAASGMLGMTHMLGRDIIAGATAGASTVWTDMVDGGKSRMSGGGGGVFVARMPGAGLQWLVGASALTLGGDITRGYLNGSAPTTSSGHTSGTGYGSVARLGWVFNPVPLTQLTPFASYTVSTVRFGSYTETGGPFPAQFDALRETVQTVRLGADVRYTFAPRNWAWGTLAFAHRLDEGRGVDVSGTLIGLFSMTVPGVTSAPDWAEITGGLRLSPWQDGALTLSLTALVPGNQQATYVSRVGIMQTF